MKHNALGALDLCGARDASAFDSTFGGGSVATKTLQRVHLTPTGHILVVDDTLSVGRHFP